MSIPEGIHFMLANVRTWILTSNLCNDHVSGSEYTVYHNAYSYRLFISVFL
jgi:hypothetical protein